jgi:hypothetical protein
MLPSNEYALQILKRNLEREKDLQYEAIKRSYREAVSTKQRESADRIEKVVVEEKKELARELAIAHERKVKGMSRMNQEARDERQKMADERLSMRVVSASLAIDQG